MPDHVEYAYRRGVHQALSWALDHPDLLTAQTVNIAGEMRAEHESVGAFLDELYSRATKKER